MTYLLIKCIKNYQWISKRFLSQRCRFEETCSHYAIRMLKTQNIAKALYKIIYRLFSCHPYSKQTIMRSLK